MSRDSGRRGSGRESSGDSARISTLRDLAPSIAATVAAIGLIFGATDVAVSKTASMEADTQVVASASLLTRLGIAPAITPALAGSAQGGSANAAATSAFGATLRQRVLPGSGVVSVVVLTPTGQVLYSNEPGRPLQGSTIRLSSVETAVLRTGTPQLETGLALPAADGSLAAGADIIQVDVRIISPVGGHLLVALTETQAELDASEAPVWKSMHPVLGAGASVLLLLMLPLSFQLARRLSRSQRERAVLLQRAIDASDDERRRIASDLHDGTVQNLTAMSLTLSNGARRLRMPETRADPASLATQMETAAAGARAAVTDLRTLIIEIAPPDLTGGGLEVALRQLVAPLQQAGVNVELTVTPELVLSVEQTSLIYRVAQEAVRNVTKYAGARSVTMAVEQAPSGTSVDVRDDGIGFAPTTIETRRHQGHVGLALLQQRVSESGSTITIESAPGSGTHIHLEVPSHAVGADSRPDR